MKIFLAGSVPKGDEEKKTFKNWRKDYQIVLEKILKAECIDPHDRNIDEGDPLAIVGADCLKIRESDLVVVNATERLGAGTSQEFVIAKYFQKPVITVLPKDSYHRKSNVMFEGVLLEDWIHPFIHAFSDVIIHDLNEVKDVDLNALLNQPKSIEIIDQAISYISAKK